MRYHQRKYIIPKNHRSAPNLKSRIAVPCHGSRELVLLAVIAMQKHRPGNTDITVLNKFTSTQAMASELLFESRSIIPGTVQHYWKYIPWLYSDSKNMALACKKIWGWLAFSYSTRWPRKRCYTGKVLCCGSWVIYILWYHAWRFILRHFTFHLHCKVPTTFTPWPLEKWLLAPLLVSQVTS